MTSTEKYGITKFDEQYYVEKVVDFILNNPGCTKEDILKKEREKPEGQREIGRKRLYAILKKLKRKKVIKERKLHKKARNIMLFVREDNPVYIISNELREFENLYPCLLTKVKEQLERWQSGKTLLKPDPTLLSTGNESSDWSLLAPLELIIYSTLLLFETMRINILRSAMIWSKTIRDKYTKEILNYTIFSTFFEMQNKMSETLGTVTLLRDVKGGQQNVLFTSIATELSEIRERVGHAIHNLDSYEIKKEIEPILNFVMKIILTEMAREKIYSESATYKWKINPNDVEKLADSLYRDNPTLLEIYDRIYS